MKMLDIGNSNFKDIIEKDYYYIDKSLLIQEILEAQKQVLLIPRPRRFGKTLNLLMLKYFFEKEPDNQKLFTHLKIWNSGENILKHQGKYPVIYLSFKDAKADNWHKVLEHVKSEIAKAYERHQYLLDSNIITDIQKEHYISILKLTANETIYETSLKQLSEYLYRYHQEQVVILVDEYDTPIQSGYNKFYDDVVPFMRNLLSGAFKDNLSLFKGVITGILRVSRESIFSGLNNLSVFSILDKRMAEHFGFTEDEVKKILSDFKVSTSYQQVKEWYDGYIFGDTSDIYNPWSILNYVVENEIGFKPYWINTSSDTLLKEHIKSKNSDEARELILKLISGETIEKPIEENFVFPALNTNRDLLWTLLTFSGYLTIHKKLNLGLYELKIPNYEISYVFKNIILYWFQSEVKIYRNLLEDTMRALVGKKPEQFAEGFQRIIGDTFSYYDTDSTPVVRYTKRATQQPEKVYQAYTLGLLAILSDDYIIRSNRESGSGRYDILLIPQDKKKNGVVMELKSIPKKKSRETKKNFSERVDKEINEALQQIEEKKYYSELIEHRTAGIIKVSAVFAGKEVFVKMV
ncbi:MAG: AAA family ATPase [Leptospiraceae bacterium]|nr:AAA family ATPase [Leptospiraceae bacterium]